MPSSARGISRSQALALDPGALAAVRASREATLTEFPLGADGTGPATLCKLPTQPLKSQLVMKNKTPDEGNQVVWKWTKGQDTSLLELGSPDTTDDYELCVYGPGSSLLFSGRIPAGGLCHGVACWKTITGKGFNYKDKDRTPDGMEKLQLKAGTGGAAKMAAKGKGDHLNMPTLGSLGLPIVTQLRGAGTCWEASYSTSLVNTPEQFKAKSD